MAEAGSQNQPDEAMIDLLIKQVTEGLSPAEQRALDALDDAVTSDYRRDFERAAAAISLAGLTSASATSTSSAIPTALPADLRARLELQAANHVAAVGETPGSANVLAFRPSAPAAPAPVPPIVRRSGAGGWLAAAACLVLAVVGWMRSPAPIAPPPAANVTVTVPPAVVKPPVVPAAPPTPAQARDALLARADTMKVTLAPTKDAAAAGVTGDVVWNPETQEGYIHFVGLKPNDPQVQQYQAWVVDGTRDKRYFVDGGIFDVPAGATEVVVPIHAAIPVRVAKAFAVTVEKAGGAVVSGREHVVALGAAG